MREAEVRLMHTANARRSVLLLAQWEFLKTRQEAFERVIKASRLKDRIRWMIWPKDFINVVDVLQIKLLDEGKEKMKAAAEKPKLTIVGANGRG